MRDGRSFRPEHPGIDAPCDPQTEGATDGDPRDSAPQRTAEIRSSREASERTHQPAEERRSTTTTIAPRRGTVAADDDIVAHAGLARRDGLMADDRPRTWHHGLVARYWAEVNVAEAGELAYWRSAIERSGEPVLDLGCGSGRLLVPLSAAGIEIDGTDISDDMLAYARDRARAAGASPTLTAQSNHELDLPRRYRTVIACGAIGIGGRRDRDLEAMRRVFRHLEPGGTFVMDQQLAYDRGDEGWRRWLPGQQVHVEAWPETPDRTRMTDGDEIELVSRLAAFDRLEARHTLEIRARLWRDGALVGEELGTLDECLYLVPELRLMLETAGFAEVRVEGPYTGRPAEADDRTVVFVARRGD